MCSPLIAFDVFPLAPPAPLSAGHVPGQDPDPAPCILHPAAPPGHEPNPGQPQFECSTRRIIASLESLTKNGSKYNWIAIS